MREGTGSKMGFTNSSWIRNLETPTQSKTNLLQVKRTCTKFPLPLFSPPVPSLTFFLCRVLMRCCWDQVTPAREYT